nr:angiopoietin-related protein 3-like isoform X1 [Oncorhynchus nerka]
MKLTLTFLFVLVAYWPLVLCAKEEPMSKDSPLPQVPAVETRSRFAALDDVRLLANGLLQLGHSLRDFVHKTKSQINDIFQKLNIFDSSFNQLSVLASEIKGEEEELKKTTVVLKANNEEIRNLSLEINSKVESILQERSQLRSKVGGLEVKLSSLSQGLVPAEQLAEINSLKDVIHTQERSISELLKAVREQSDQLDHQRSKMKTLEVKLTYNPFMQETIEKPSDNFQSATPTLAGYLTNTSTNGSLDMTDLSSDCSELFNKGERASGVYAIKPNQSEPFMVYCDMGEDGGATVIQRRKDGSMNFHQNWEKYENGFGDFQGEFWLGLRKIHSLASQGDTFLNIQLEDWKRGKRFIEYNFSLDGPEAHYRIHLSQASGNLPDAMSNHTGMMFSTKDQDNDKLEDSHCAYTYTGGWWFNACGDTNLNGKYIHVRPKGRSERRRGIHWIPTRGASYFLRSTQISIRFTPATTFASTSSETGNFSSE